MYTYYSLIFRQILSICLFGSGNKVKLFNYSITLGDQLRRFLGIIGTNTITGKYVGDTPVKPIVHKWLYIYLDQLSTTSNIVDSAPSTLLTIVPASDSRGIINRTPPNPIFKKLEVGHIN